MTLLIGVLLASLAGSVHCAAMCGAFVCAYAAPRAPASSGSGAHLSYHGGRLTSYLLLGALAGALGAGVERVGALAGIGRAAAVVAGVLMVLWAAGEFARLAGARLPAWSVDSGRRVLGRVLMTQRDAPVWRRSLALGLLTTLIPCGWLYAFAVTAGATGNPLSGMAVMAAFWAGTLPMLLAVALGVNRALAHAGRRWTMAAALAVMVLGLLTISGRIQPVRQIHTATRHVSH